MSTLLTLINEVLRRCGQAEVSTLVNAQSPAIQARDFLNEIYFELMQRLQSPRLLKAATLTTTAGTPLYTLPADGDINGILTDAVIDNATRTVLTEMALSDALRLSGSGGGRPAAFYRQGVQLGFYPVPDAAYVIQYQYIIRPANLNADADTTQLPAEWLKVLLLGTQARLEGFLGENNTETFLLYRDGLAQLRARAPMKPIRRMKGYYRGAR